jgi:hypothetical protein
MDHSGVCGLNMPMALRWVWFFWAVFAMAFVIWPVWIAVFQTTPVSDFDFYSRGPHHSPRWTK